LPFTPLHYPIAYVLYMLNKKLSLPGLAVGAMFPDLEIPVIVLLCGYRIPGNRLVLHSVLGGATLGTALAIAFTVFAYPSLINRVFKVSKAKIKQTRLSVSLVVSCLIGNLSHVLLDVVNHPYNPLFWPFSPLTPSPICQALGGLENASLIVSLLCLILFAIILVRQRGNVWEKLLVGE
jgi:membrane-bound metal-dependent hydrolase YbcI (DUF457 family)